MKKKNVNLEGRELVTLKEGYQREGWSLEGGTVAVTPFPVFFMSSTLPCSLCHGDFFFAVGWKEQSQLAMD